jgi:hypothetical protein
MRPRGSPPCIAKVWALRRKDRIDEAIGQLSEAIALGDKYASLGLLQPRLLQGAGGLVRRNPFCWSLRKSAIPNPSYKEKAKQDPDFHNVLTADDFTTL